MTQLHLLPDNATMYRALVEKDPAYEGLFFAGVTTTGIFCRPTCTARKPRRENVLFFASAGEALGAGYRPCRLCRPMEPPGAAPEPLRRLLEEVESDPGCRLSDADLRARGLDPGAVRRWFKRHHGMTFQGYQRALRVGMAFGRLAQGGRVFDAALDHGWESLSAFNDAFRQVMGASPRRATGPPVVVDRLVTPLGPMLAGASERGACLLEFADRRMLETQLERLGRRLGAALVPGSSPCLEQLEGELERYFAGELREFETPLDLRGTEFQQRVWTALCSIPYGQTRSYGEQAQLLGEPEAVRAVARANGDNRLAIVVPCHRVVGADGSLTGYGGGLWRKRWLLDLERSSLARSSTSPVA